MMLPPHDKVPTLVPGFVRLVWIRPPLRLPNGAQNPDVFRDLGAIGRAEKALKPWTLFEPSEAFPAVRLQRNLWTRVTTWWLNFRRRRALRELEATAQLRAQKYFELAEIQRRASANETK